MSESAEASGEQQGTAAIEGRLLLAMIGIAALIDIPAFMVGPAGGAAISAAVLAAAAAWVTAAVLDKRASTIPDSPAPG